MTSDNETLTGSAVVRTTLGESTIITPPASITYESCPDVRDALGLAMETPQPMVIIDCRKVRALDSEALEMLLEWHTKLKDSGGILKLAGLNDVCTDILVSTRLVNALNVCADIRQAIEVG